MSSSPFGLSGMSANLREIISCPRPLDFHQCGFDPKQVGYKEAAVYMVETWLQQLADLECPLFASIATSLVRPPSIRGNDRLGVSMEIG